MLRDADGNVVASRSPSGELVGEPYTDRLESYDVYIAKSFEKVPEPGAGAETEIA